MNHKYFIALALVVLILFCTSCTAPMSNDETTELNLPTPETGKALIFGVLLNENNQQPITGSPFLAKALMTGKPDLPITVSFSLQNDPGAEYDIESGLFYFENVEPGDNYVIMLVYGPGSFVVVEEPSSQLPLVISVEQGEMLDLGTITVKE